MQRTAHGIPSTDQQLWESASDTHAPREHTRAARQGEGGAGSTSLEEGEKVSLAATRHRRGEQARDIRGVG
jgi:hypothetical protein